MRLAGINMKTVIKREALLEVLKKNAAHHALIVKEAREGYLKSAKEALEQRLDVLMRESRKGKIVGLSFNLHPPQDYTEVYKVAIKMLEVTQQEEIELGPDEFSQLYLDQWNWSHDFLFKNSTYSHQAFVDMDGISSGRND
jgi:hypothetical protein